MKSKIIKTLTVIFIVFSLTFLTNCSRKKNTTTNPEPVSIDNVDILMIDGWDRYQMLENRSSFPSLIAEDYLKVFKHEIIENGSTIGGDDYQFL